MKTIEEILQGIPDKHGSEKNTTSLKWKTDVIRFFKDMHLKSCVELGTWHGRSTRMLSEIFEEVWTIEYLPHRVEEAKKFCKDSSNITFICGDVYDDSTYESFPKYFDVVVIDCDHTFKSLIKDIDRGLKFRRPDGIIYFVFDDYGHSELKGVHDAIDFYIKNKPLKIEKYIGHSAGTIINRGDNPPLTLFDYEGLIVSFKE